MRGPTSSAIRWVFPPVCGGTTVSRRRDAQAHGLSPRVRGNLSSPAHTGRRPRSIPACAGEPTLRSSKRVDNTVYPRVCGGTSTNPATNPPNPGLSPRVRGNRHQLRAVPLAERSIPACAGEPACLCPWTWPRRVYPRVCGATRLIGGTGSSRSSTSSVASGRLASLGNGMR